MQSAELSQDLNKTPIVNILNKNQKVLESVTDIQALKTFLVDIIKVIQWCLTNIQMRF
jgi:hypothetical protein